MSKENPKSAGVSSLPSASVSNISTEVFPSKLKEATFPCQVSIAEMKALAKKLRRHIVTMTTEAGSGHPGGSLSAVEAVTTLFVRIMRHNPSDPCWQDRDRFILSKGHSAPLLYAILAELGYFPVDELKTLRKLGSRLQGHTDMTCTPGVEMSAGSLGQGLSFAIGVALAGRLDYRDYRVYALLGDGECEEGQVWEAVVAGAHLKLDNLVAIVDHNKQQIDGYVRDIMNIEPLSQKWLSFGWHVAEVDGHDFPQIISALEQTKEVTGKPSAIISHTTKGKGVSFMENNLEFHGKAASAEQLRQALEELA